MKKTNQAFAKRLAVGLTLGLCLFPFSSPAQVTPTCDSPHGSYFGGPIISQVEIVPVFWNSSVNSQVVANMPQFYADITKSTYWTWLREYSTPTQTILPGSATAGITIVPTQCASSTSCYLTDDQVQTELVRQVGLGVLPAPTSNTVYMVHFPPNISLSAFGLTSCVDFCAYHNSFMSGTNVYVYGCILDQTTGGCSNCSADATGLEDTTDTASHELVESVTDPYIGLYTGNNYGYPCAWADNNNNCGELADICSAYDVAGDSITVNGRTWVVQEIWSDCQGQCTSSGPTNAAASLTNQSAITFKNSAVAITLNSYPGCLAYGHAYTVTANPAHGSLSGTAPNLTYTPAAGYSGPDSFQFLDTGIGVMTNGNNVPATVSIAVLPLTFSITSASLGASGTNFTVCWHSVPGGVYSVLTNSSLATAPASWPAAGNPITATSSNTCFTLPGGIGGKPRVFVVIKQ